MVTQEIMDEWMDGGMVFSNNNLKKNERVSLLFVFIAWIFFIKGGSQIEADIYAVSSHPVTRNDAMCSTVLYTSFTEPKPLKLLRLLKI